jgi:hypothetical protein
MFATHRSPPVAIMGPKPRSTWVKLLLINILDAAGPTFKRSEARTRVVGFIHFA